MEDDHDTALARRLHETDALPLDELQRLLEEVRRRRDAEPGLSLGALLAERRRVDSTVLSRTLVEVSFGARPRSDGAGHLPKRLGDHRIVRELARGGMGAVYEAVHEPTGARRALKTLLPIGLELDADGEERERLRQEALALGRLDHPGVVRVHGADLSAAVPYLVQDLLSGGSLEARLRDGPLPTPVAVDLIAELSAALAHAHANGVLHRDLKPSNVLFDERGHAKLVDFGLARRVDASLRLTLSGTVLGTPGFMPPEQATGGGTDARSDVYGLGALLFACLTGRPPFVGSTALGVMAQVLEKPPPLPSSLNHDVGPALDAVVTRALAKEKAERFPSAEAFADALRSVEVDAPRRRGPPPMLLGILGALALLSGGLLLHAGRRPPADTAPTSADAPAPKATTSEPAEAPPPHAFRWDLKTGEKVRVRIGMRATIFAPGQPPQPSRLSYQLRLEAKEVKAGVITLTGRVDRLRMRLEGEVNVDVDSARPREAHSDATRMVLGPFFDMRGTRVTLSLGPRPADAKLSGLPTELAVSKRVRFDPNHSLRRILMQAAGVLPDPARPLAKTWTRSVKLEAEVSVERVFFGRATKHHVLSARRDDRASIRTWIRDDEVRWDDTGTLGFDPVGYTLQGTAEFDRGAVTHSEVTEEVRWRIPNGAELRAVQHFWIDLQR